MFTSPSSRPYASSSVDQNDSSEFKLTQEEHNIIAETAAFNSMKHRELDEKFYAFLEQVLSQKFSKPTEAEERASAVNHLEQLVEQALHGLLRFIAEDLKSRQGLDDEKLQAQKVANTNLRKLFKEWGKPLNRDKKSLDKYSKKMYFLYRGLYLDPSAKPNLEEKELRALQVAAIHAAQKRIRSIIIELDKKTSITDFSATLNANMVLCENKLGTLRLQDEENCIQLFTARKARAKEVIGSHIPPLPPRPTQTETESKGEEKQEVMHGEADCSFDPNSQDRDGNTLLHHAVIRYLTSQGEKNYRFISLLLKHGARLDITNKDGITPLDIVPKNVVARNIQDKDRWWSSYKDAETGNGLLHWMIHHGHSESVALLLLPPIASLDNDEVFVANKINQTPLTMVSSKNRDNLFHLAIRATGRLHLYPTLIKKIVTIAGDSASIVSSYLGGAAPESKSGSPSASEVEATPASKRSLMSLTPLPGSGLAEAKRALAGAFEAALDSPVTTSVASSPMTTVYFEEKTQDQEDASVERKKFTLNIARKTLLACNKNKETPCGLIVAMGKAEASKIEVVEERLLKFRERFKEVFAYLQQEIIKESNLNNRKILLNKIIEIDAAIEKLAGLSLSSKDLRKDEDAILENLRKSSIITQTRGIFVSTSWQKVETVVQKWENIPRKASANSPEVCLPDDSNRLRLDMQEHNVKKINVWVKEMNSPRAGTAADAQVQQLLEPATDKLTPLEAAAKDITSLLKRQAVLQKGVSGLVILFDDMITYLDGRKSQKLLFNRSIFTDRALAVRKAKIDFEDKIAKNSASVQSLPALLKDLKKILEDLKNHEAVTQHRLGCFGRSNSAVFIASVADALSSELERRLRK